MAIEFNSAALDTFRTANFEDANTIAHLDGKGIKFGGTWALSFKILGRTTAERQANNAIRTELLKSLGKAFHLTGYSTHDDGTVTFSKAFMDRLAHLLGPDFKREDFGVPTAGGEVRSGKPLTQRRITAILTRAEEVANDPGKTDDDIAGISSGSILATKRTDVKTNDAYDAYARKLDAIKEELGLAGRSEAEIATMVDKNPALRMFVNAEKGLKYLMNELDVKPLKKGQYDPSCLRLREEYDFMRDLGENTSGMVRFEYKDPKTGEWTNFTKPDAYKDSILWHVLGGELVHTERAHFSISTSEDVKALRDYVIGTIKLFVMKTIDLYFAAKEQDKLELYMAHLKSPGACLEDKGMHLVKFEEENLRTETWKPMDKAEAAEMERIADQATAEGAPPPKTEDLIYSELDALGKQDDKLAISEDWKDFADKAKEHLVGKTAQIMVAVPDKNGISSFKPLIEDGKPVIRPLTAEDIDRLGPACLFNIANI